MKFLLVIAAGTLLLGGCSKPLDEDKREFAGLWKSNQTSLLITQSGRLEYESQKGAVTTSISMPIKTIDKSGIEAGFLFFSSSFELQGKPKEEDGMLVLVVDGEKLFKTDELGRIPKATKVPALNEIRPLVMNELSIFSRGINAKDFTGYIENASLLFQSQFSNENLLEAYRVLTDKYINLEDWMVGDFILTSEPTIDENGILSISGKFPTAPSSLKFTLSYVYSHPDWKGSGVSININDE